MAGEGDGPVILLSGASGIAAAAARLFASAGCSLVVVDRQPDSLASLCREIPKAVPHEADLCVADAADTAVAKALTCFGRLDVLVNVAGISGRRFGDGPVDACTDLGWETVLQSNLTTTFRMCRSALKPMLAAGRGSIVNVSSVLGFAPGGALFATHAYAASKGAIIALSRAMAGHYAPHHIRVNVVAPGLIATPMSARAQEDEATKAYIRTRQALTGDLGTPEDVAWAIEYLALERAAFVTGVVLEVSGGWSVTG
jgi:NAD(P)-dependent dehydrogenase (short-subunit alcohol dehydrogenase family)